MDLWSVCKSIFSGLFLFFFTIHSSLPGPECTGAGWSRLSCTFPPRLLHLYLMGFLDLFVFLENERQAGDMIFIIIFYYL